MVDSVIRLLRRLLLLGTLLLAGTPARAEELVLYAAGSLRPVLRDVADRFQATTGVPVRTEFGPSGLLRERIERGERVDVFASADMGHPLRLHADGRARQVAMFTRNALCAVAVPALGLTPETMIDRMLDPAVGLGTSTPGDDPAGDYTWAMFRRIDAIRPGSFAVLDAKAKRVVGGAATLGDVGGRDRAVIALESGATQMHLGYCSGAPDRVRQLPSLTIVPLPAAIRVGPEYGLAVLRDARRRAAEFALFILSPEAQALLAEQGFDPVGRVTQRE